jgi:anti-anti-sigma factor
MPLTATLSHRGRTALIILKGELDAQTAPAFRDEVAAAAKADVDELVLDLTDLSYLSSAGLRSLVFARQKMADDVRVVLVRPTDAVEQTIRLVGFHHSVVFSDQVPE